MLISLLCDIIIILLYKIIFIYNNIIMTSKYSIKNDNSIILKKTCKCKKKKLCDYCISNNKKLYFEIINTKFVL